MPVVQSRLSNELLFGLLWFVGQLQAQLNPKFDHYGIEDGLSQSNVKTVISEPNGAVWSGTQDGLNHFDGFEFKHVTKENTPQISSSFVLCSESDPQGNLWFGTKKELLFFNVQTRAFTSCKNPFSSVVVRQIVSYQQELLCLYEDGRLFSFSIERRKFNEIRLLFPIKHLIKGDSKPHLLDASGDLYVFLGLGKLKKVYSFGNASVYSAFSVGGSLVFFMKDKIRVLKDDYRSIPSPFSGFPTSLNAQVVSVISHDTGFLIGVKGNGLFFMDSRKNWKQYATDFYHSNALKSNNINCLYKDRENVIWVGTERGLSCFREEKNSWLKIGQSSNPNKGLISEKIWSFGKYRNTLLLGGDQEITLYNPNLGDFQHIKLSGKIQGSPYDVSVMDIEPLKNSKFLLACFDGLLWFDAEKRTFEKVVLGPKLREKHRHFYTLFCVEGNILIGTSAGILSLSKTTKNVKEVHFQPFDVCRNFLKDQAGNIWCISDKSGLSNLNPASFELTSSKFNPSLRKKTSDVFSCLIQPYGNTLFVGTLGSGIVKLNTVSGRADLLDKNSGLPNNVINGLMMDASGTIWTSTNLGLAYMNPNQEGKARFVGFGEEDFEYNSNAIFQEGGNLYFGGIFGFVVFSNKSISEKHASVYPKISMVRLKKSSAEWPTAQISDAELKERAYKITLPYYRRDFEVCFQPNVLYKSKKLEYKCEIIGETSNTIFLGNTNHVSFNYLSSGTYYLRIYSRVGKNGSWTETPALLTVQVQPPFWGSQLFFSIYVLLGLCLAYAYVRINVVRERKERHKLEEIVKERTHEIQQKKEEIELKNTAIMEEKNKVLAQQKLLYLEKMNAEKWLKNALPEQAVKELQRLGKVRPKSYDSATILFTDVVGFNKISESLTPARLVNKLDGLFKKFDAIVKERNIEKIKTIGDAYMAVGGIPEANATHAIDVCLAALLIQDYMAKHKFDALANGKDFWEIRIGINTGTVTAGIIGNLKIAYDVWGSAVNQAQRMEQLAEPGTISITETTFRMIEPYFEVRFKGEAPMKSSLLINRYELLHIKHDLSLRGEGLIPNDLFYEISQLHLYSPIKYYSVEAEVLRMLEEQLPKNLYYHSVDHTRMVINAVEHLALCEGVRDEGLFLLKTAALFHDLGFTQQYEHNESIGVKLAQKILPDFGYSDLHIQTVSELIFATEVPHKPVNKLQEILCDADLGYLGTDDFEITSQKLKQELIEKGKIMSDKHWDEVQVPFLENHRYFTPTAIASRGPKKEENLAAVRKRLEENNYG
jgi:class 3 adenylate cyclase/ligand-binding sensor domain-containing protein/predicted metal-dependent HD superfamily phosphohydrolase